MSNPLEELRLAREAAGLGLEDVEKRIFVQSQYLRAIEEGNFSVLPGHSYARMIIRSYAKCLGVSPEPILRYYEEQSQGFTVEVSRRPLPSRKERFAEGKGRRRDWKPALSALFARLSSNKFKFGALLLILLLGVASALYFFGAFGGGPGENKAASVEASQARGEGSALSQSFSLSTENEVIVRLVKTSESNEHGDEYVIDNADEVIVTIKASDKSWFRVRGGGPTHPVMKDGYIQPGQTETFTHSEWISLHLGRPDKIELRVNGYVVDTEGMKKPQTFQFRLSKKSGGKGKS